MNDNERPPQEPTLHALSWRLRDLTANLVRVTRGTGKAYQIVNQLEAALLAFVEYQKAFGHWPVEHEISEALSVDRSEEWVSRSDGPELNRRLAQEAVVSGALQMTASRLLRQSNHESMGQYEMYAGCRGVQSALEEMNRERAAQHKASRATPRRRKRVTASGTSAERKV
jgi:hypothetical protein